MEKHSSALPAIYKGVKQISTYLKRNITHIHTPLDTRGRRNTHLCASHLHLQGFELGTKHRWFAGPNLQLLQHLVQLTAWSNRTSDINAVSKQSGQRATGTWPWWECGWSQHLATMLLHRGSIVTLRASEQLYRVGSLHGAYWYC